MFVYGSGPWWYGRFQADSHDPLSDIVLNAFVVTVVECSSSVGWVYLHFQEMHVKSCDLMMTVKCIAIRCVCFCVCNAVI